MCAYSMVGGWYDDHRWLGLPKTQPDQSWMPEDYVTPFVPFKMPDPEIIRNAIKELKEYLEILREVKKLEDASPCPCANWEERGKPDYIKKFTDKIAELEQALAEQMLKTESDVPRCCNHAMQDRT